MRIVRRQVVEGSAVFVPVERESGVVEKMSAPLSTPLSHGTGLQTPAVTSFLSESETQLAQSVAASMTPAVQLVIDNTIAPKAKSQPGMGDDARARFFGGREGEKKKRKPPSCGVKAISELRAFVDEAWKSGDWSGASARHLTVLYGKFHEVVYGVPAAELEHTEGFRKATFMCSWLLRKEFHDDPEEMIKYVTWAWNKEREKERYRLQNGRVAGRRLSPWILYSDSMVSDFRIETRRGASLRKATG